MTESLPPAAASSSRADATRMALVEAGLRLFGTLGFAATSTRALAEEAQTNVASIAYHFGGKEGLRRACAEHFADTVRGALVPALAADLPADPAAARARLEQGARALVGFIVGGRGSRDLAGFMLRELTENGPGIDIAYAGLVEPVHGRFCNLWALATGQDPQSPRVRLSTFALLGQVLYFRIGQPIVLRRMGWPAAGPGEVAAIADIVVSNLKAILEAESRT